MGGTGRMGIMDYRTEPETHTALNAAFGRVPYGGGVLDRVDTTADVVRNIDRLAGVLRAHADEDLERDVEIAALRADLAAVRRVMLSGSDQDA